MDGAALADSLLYGIPELSMEMVGNTDWVTT
ncbi:hypothetical protein CCACVL1_28024 [Corchorus capsularis]|uniref:Uncharacterized protein n=1 Tax=Corchorus capsularis TaxID=210143 RepID=A0A1R3G7R0_COCAP|nr:hypothetical protein CCACVL1_28024 [Corchorus capsularis]